MTSTMNKPTASQAEAKYSGIFLFFGIALVVLGVIAAAASVLTTIATVVVLGGILVAAGLAECVHTYKVRRQQDILLNVISALLYLSMGGMLLYNPLIGALSLTAIVSVFLIAAGAIRVAYGAGHRDERHWPWFILGGATDVTLGALIALGWPVTALWAIGLFVGIEVMIYGYLTITVSLALKEFEQAMGPG